MSEARWDRMWGLFHEALARPAAERSVWLAGACQGDDELRREVHELLSAHEEAERGGAGPLATAAASGEGSPAALPGPAPGARIGCYRVVRELGSGGMGVVVLAERADGEVEREVAIKLLPAGADSAEALRRFRQERQILARLDHPSIARLLDAGTTADGRPYFVMEHVAGEPIDAWCRERRLPVEARLELVRAVSAAVHAAHQNLVVHRDLKPGNILVAADGTPKLLDFGIAKLLAASPAAGAAPPTVGPWRPMTPEYASPEQVRGEAVTTASDVYALGVLLYELLAGRHPFGEAASSPEGLARRLAGAEPERPSLAVAGGGERGGAAPAGLPGVRERLAKRLAGDLDTIVLRAMHPDPARRYPSAEALADDLARHLAGLPVRARRDTFGYRAGKLLRRHRLAAAAAALFVALLAGAVAVLAVQSARLDAERREAERERRRAERVSEFLVELFEVSYPVRSRGETITARELLDRGAERIASGLDDEPEVRAELLRTIGKVYESLGLYDEAVPLVEDSLAVARELHGGRHAEVALRLSDLAILAHRRGDAPAAEALHRQAIALRRELYGDDHPEVAASLNALAVMLHDVGEYERSEAAFREALAIQRRAHGETSWQVSQVLGNLGWLLHDRGRFDEAEALYRRNLEINRRGLGAAHRWVAKSLSNIALLLHDRGELAAAAEVYRRAWELDAKLLDDTEHPDLAIHLHNHARLAHDRGDLDAAERLYRQALALRQRALPAEHPALATSLAGLGRLLVDRGDAAAAEPLLRRALALRRAALAPGNWHLAEVESLLGACLLAQGRREEAAPLLTAAAAAIEAQRGPRDLRARQARRRLGALGAG